MQVFSDNVSKLNYYAAWVHGLSFAGILAAFIAKPEEANFNTDLFTFKIVQLSNNDKDVDLDVVRQSKIPTDMLKTFVLLTFILTCIFHNWI